VIMFRIQDAFMEELGVEVPMDQMFLHSTVASISAYIESLDPMAPFGWGGGGGGRPAGGPPTPPRPTCDSGRGFSFCRPSGRLASISCSAAFIHSLRR
jgi:hypothetical protein